MKHPTDTLASPAIAPKRPEAPRSPALKVKTWLQAGFVGDVPRTG